MYEGYLKRDDPSFATRAISEGYNPDNETTSAIVPPITLATSFKQEGLSNNKGFRYSRFDNPGRKGLEQCLASLDNAKYGLCFASGVSTVTSVINLLSPGDHIVAGEEIYGGSYTLLSKVTARMHIETTFVDARDPKNVERAIKENTKVLWIETPTNPLLKLADIKKLSEIAHKHADIIVVVDNTFLTPYFQKPLSLGADVVVYSLTKYINGHADVLMGSMATNNQDLYEKLKFVRDSLGIVPSPFDCYLVKRSLYTLALRMDQHMRNSIAVGMYLESHPKIERVLMPALPSHPQHELLKRQCYGYSGMVSFYIKGGVQQAEKFLKSLKVITNSGSLGNCNSLAMLPAFISHVALTQEERDKLGITDNLVRMTVGLESSEDLIADIAQALDQMNN